MSITLFGITLSVSLSTNWHKHEWSKWTPYYLRDGVYNFRECKTCGKTDAWTITLYSK